MTVRHHLPVNYQAGPLQVIDDTLEAGGRDPLLDAALGPAMLQQTAYDNVSQGGPETLRIYRPRPTLGFSGRDAASPGIAKAVTAARSMGFDPVRRGPGGRAAAYHRGALCLDHVGGDDPGPQQIRSRFLGFGELLTGVLQRVGVNAELGPVPGEYCPGEFSVNDGHGHKLVGTAQRLVRGGWLFGTVILVTDPEPVRQVLTNVYAALGLDWEPGTVGAVETTVPGVTVGDIKSAVLEAYSCLGPVVVGDLTDDVLELSRSRIDRHRLPM
jgi:lipoate-protein ligase A